MIKSNDPLIPPFRFAIVEEGLFRGSYPTDRNFRFLKRFKLKTIVSLTPKPPTKSFYTFCERYGTTSKHFTVSKFKDDVTLSASQVVQLLEMMIEPSNLPMYIHCLDGANVTGTIFMCLRKLQNWNLSSIFTEFTRFTRGGTIVSSEAEFVETFKAEIDVPPQTPFWLWQGIRMNKHPTLKLRLVGNNQQPVLLALQQQQQLQQVPTIYSSNSNYSTPISSKSSSSSSQQQQQQSQSNNDELLNGNILQKLIDLNNNNNLDNVNIEEEKNKNSSNNKLDNNNIDNNKNKKDKKDDITSSSSTSNIDNQSVKINDNQNVKINNNNNQSDNSLITSASVDTTKSLSIVEDNSKSNDDKNIKTTTAITNTTTTTAIATSSNIQSTTIQSTTLNQQQQTITPNISSVLTQSPKVVSTASPLMSTSNITSSSKDKERDKKKKLEDIKLQFDSGKFMTQKESRFLEALSLERKPQSSYSSNISSSSTTTTSTTTTTSQSQNQSPNTTRHALFLSSNPNDS